MSQQVVAVWLLNGDVERMEIGLNCVPLKGFTLIHFEIYCLAGVAIPSR